MRDTTRDRYITYEEYLRIEEESRDVRHEYVGGVLYAMVGASKRHNEIIGNLVERLRPVARRSECSVYFTDVKLRVADDIVYYPDLIAVCDPDDTDPLVATSPCLVVEVLSPSTTATDRREKLLAYRHLPSLMTYLVVYQDEPRVEHHWRDESGGWHAAFMTDGEIPIPCLGIRIPLADIYEEPPPASA